MIFGRTILPIHFPFERMSTMTSLFRPLLTSMLCCVIAFGHAPAWLHVATCDDHCGHESSAGHVDATPHAHVCPLSGHGRQAAGTIEQVRLPSDVPLGAHTPHDSDGCGICQSLAAPCGFADAIVASPTYGVSCESIDLQKPAVEIASQLSLPPLRGPPQSCTAAI